MTEDKMLEKLENLMFYKRMHHCTIVPNCNYRKSGTYSPQWRQIGATRYYKLPRGNVVATMDVFTGECRFNANGLSPPVLHPL